MEVYSTNGEGIIFGIPAVIEFINQNKSSEKLSQALDTAALTIRKIRKGY